MYEKVPSDVAKLGFWGCFCLSGAKNCAILKVISLPYLSCDARTNVIFRDVAFKQSIFELWKDHAHCTICMKAKNCFTYTLGVGEEVLFDFSCEGQFSNISILCSFCVAQPYFGWRWGFGVILFHCFICIVLLFRLTNALPCRWFCFSMKSRLRWGGRKGHLTSL